MRRNTALLLCAFWSRTFKYAPCNVRATPCLARISAVLPQRRTHGTIRRCSSEPLAYVRQVRALRGTHCALSCLCLAPFSRWDRASGVWRVLVTYVQVRSLQRARNALSCSHLRRFTATENPRHNTALQLRAPCLRTASTLPATCAQRLVLLASCSVFRAEP